MYFVSKRKFNEEVDRKVCAEMEGKFAAYELERKRTEEELKQLNRQVSEFYEMMKTMRK